MKRRAAISAEAFVTLATGQRVINRDNGAVCVVTDPPVGRYGISPVVWVKHLVKGVPSGVSYPLGRATVAKFKTKLHKHRTRLIL